MMCFLVAQQPGRNGQGATARVLQLGAQQLGVRQLGSQQLGGVRNNAQQNEPHNHHYGKNVHNGAFYFKH